MTHSLPIALGVPVGKALIVTLAASVAISGCGSTEKVVATGSGSPADQSTPPSVTPEPASLPIGPPGTIPAEMPARAVLVGTVLDATVVDAATLRVSPAGPLVVITLGVIPAPGVPGANLPSAGRGLDRYELVSRDTSLASLRGTVRLVAERRGTGPLERLWLAEVSAPGTASTPNQPPAGNLMRVIVRLRVPSADTDQARAAAITAARKALLEELPADAFRIVRTYDTLPFVALELSPVALEIVRRSAHADGMQQDTLASPQGR